MNDVGKSVLRKMSLAIAIDAAVRRKLLLRELILYSFILASLLQNPEDGKSIERSMEKFIDDYYEVMPSCLFFHPDLMFLKNIVMDHDLYDKNGLCK